MLRFAIVVLVCFAVGAFGQKAGDSEFKRLNAEMTQHYLKGEFDKALTLADRVIEIVTRESGQDSLATGAALRNLAMIAEAKGDVKLAERSYDKAVDIFKKRKQTLTPAQSSTLADVLEGLGRIRAKQDLVWSARVFKEALEFREKIDGPDAASTVSPVVQLASIAFWKREFEQSSELYDRALNILGKAPKASREDIALVYYRAQCSYRRAKMEDQFKKYSWIYDLFAGTSSSVLRREDLTALRVLQMEIVNGKATHLQKPEWPSEGRQLYNDGEVVVDVLVNERGDVISACSRATDRHPVMLEASEIAAYKSKFTPPSVGGVPIKGIGRIVYKYVVKYERRSP